MVFYDNSLYEKYKIKTAKYFFPRDFHVLWFVGHSGIHKCGEYRQRLSVYTLLTVSYRLHLLYPVSLSRILLYPGNKNTKKYSDNVSTFGLAAYFCTQKCEMSQVLIYRSHRERYHSEATALGLRTCSVIHMQKEMTRSNRKSVFFVSWQFMFLTEYSQKTDFLLQLTDYVFSVYRRKCMQESHIYLVVSCCIDTTRIFHKPLLFMLNAVQLWYSNLICRERCV